MKIPSWRRGDRRNNNIYLLILNHVFLRHVVMEIIYQFTWDSSKKICDVLT